MVEDRRQGPGHAGVTWDHESHGRSGKYLRLFTGYERLQLVLGVEPRCAHFPAKTVVQGDGWRRAPTVLPVDAVVFAARIQHLVAGLGELGGSANDKVGEIKPGFLTAEVELSVGCGIQADIDLVVVEVSAELKIVGADDLGEVVNDLGRVVVLVPAAGR